MRKCNVKGCDQKKTPYYQLHKIPNKKEKKRRRRWIDVLRIISSAATKSFYVCSFHFTDNDFLGSIQRPKSILKPTAIPSQRLPGVDQKLILLREQNNRNRELRAINRRIVEEEEEYVLENESDDEDSMISFEDLAAEIEEVADVLEETQMLINMMIRNKKCINQHDKHMTQHIINVNVEMRRRFAVVCEKRAHILSLLNNANIRRMFQ